MKTWNQALLVALLITPVVGLASDNQLIKVNGTLPVALYADAKGAQKVLDVPPGDIAPKLPLTVVKEQGEYAQVKLDGKDYWVSTEQFTVKRITKIDCDKARISMKQGNTVQTGAPRGAAETEKLCESKK